MSLKTFHIMFIVISTAMSVLVGAWGIQQYRMESSSGGLAVGVTFLLSAIALVVYGLRFFKKLRALEG